MGIRATRFYFSTELPKVDVIKKKFTEITGLPVTYTPCLELNELVTDDEDFLFLLEQSINGKKTHSNGYAHFSCADFDNVYLGDYMVPGSKSFYLECGIRNENMYFFHALSKTMLELGGNIFDYHTYPHEKDLKIDEFLEPYYPHERSWKRIKKWEEMNSVERSRFKNRFR
jgi:hypothetical protein